MEYNSENMNDGELRLCSGCQQFFGKKETNFMCSVCFKQANNQTSSPTKEDSRKMYKKDSSKRIVQDEFESNRALEKIIDAHMEVDPEPMIEEKKEEKPVAEPVKKMKNRCHFCSKKTGLLGIQCKCGFTFCAKHRHGDDHKCDYDYQQESKEKLEKENPLVEFAKLTKI